MQNHVQSIIGKLLLVGDATVNVYKCIDHKAKRDKVDKVNNLHENDNGNFRTL